jgi:hypothetical protein
MFAPLRTSMMAPSSCPKEHSDGSSLLANSQGFSCDAEAQQMAPLRIHTGVEHSISHHVPPTLERLLPPTTPTSCSLVRKHRFDQHNQQCHFKISLRISKDALRPTWDIIQFICEKLRLHPTLSLEHANAINMVYMLNVQLPFPAELTFKLTLSSHFQLPSHNVSEPGPWFRVLDGTWPYTSRSSQQPPSPSSCHTWPPKSASPYPEENSNPRRSFLTDLLGKSC